MQFQVMAKPSGAACNLSCTYCFYTEKRYLYDGTASSLMPADVLESYIRQSIECQESPEFQFAWQGGEPTLLGVDYFKQVVALQEKYAAGKKVTNTLQTNGTLLTDDWCRFLKEHDFLVGLSIDGPREFHDRYRIKKDEQSTFDAVIAGLERLRKHQVSYNTLTVVNDHNSRQPSEVYRFLKRIGDGHMQFIPAVERFPNESHSGQMQNLAMPPYNGQVDGNTRLTPWSVTPQGLANFYVSIFDEWVRNDVGRVFVQFFEVALGNWLGAGSGLCQFSPKCGMAGALENNGDLYSCDHYVYPEHKLGNILETSLVDLMSSEQQQQFGSAKLESLPECCKTCEVRPACHGDCPKHRFIETPNGGPGVSYLCKAYKEIFSHMAPYLEVLAELVQKGRPAQEIMEILCQQDKVSVTMSQGRNSPCRCGSGKKYKRCCGA